MSEIKVHSLKLRYAFKLLTNLTSIPLYFIMEAILPRALGPQTYGNFHFVTNIFSQLLLFLNMGTSACFFSALARRPKNFSLVAFYAQLCFVFFILTFLITLILMLTSLGNILMPNVPIWLIPLGALWAFLSWWNKLLLSMNDALGITVKSEIIRSVFYIIGVIVIATMYLTNTLNIKSLFAQQFLLIGIMSFAYYWLMRKFWVKLSFKLNLRQYKTFCGYFLRYCNPLIISAPILFIILTFDRWILQYFSGSVEQGYFILAHKVSVACFIFVLAIIPLITRELSIAWGTHNLQLMGKLLEKYSPTVYFTVAYFSCFVAIESDIIAIIFGGEEFAEAAAPIKIMALFPIFHAYTYLANAFYLASGHTKYVRNLIIIEAIISIPLVWFLLAPEQYFGLHLGADGLAFKFIFVQIIMANISFWIVSRLIPINFWKILRHEIVTIVALLLAAFVCHNLTLYLFEINPYIRFVISGFFYSCLVLLLVISFPRLGGLSRDRLSTYFNLLLITLKLKKVS